MPAPAALLDLVARFAEQIDDYKRGRYNETQLRRDFLDPFFKLLGWDMDNSQGYAESYREVIHEDAIKIGGFTKAPDYAFRVGGTRKFFVEAKKPAVHIKEDIAPAYQLRRYAWSANLPLSPGAGTRLKGRQRRHGLAPRRSVKRHPPGESLRPT